MVDIVKRLRRVSCVLFDHGNESDTLAREAIIEITRLRSENEKLREERNEFEGLFKIAQKANASLAEMMVREGVLVPTDGYLRHEEEKR